MSQSSELEQAVSLALNLSSLDKVRLVEQVMASLELELSPRDAKKSLYGLWAELEIPADEIDESRQELWNNFSSSQL